MKKIVLVGGGTAGHVMPNIALVPYLMSQYEIHYIGSIDGIEKNLIEKIPGIVYHGIHAGKLRRYLSLKNITDQLKVLKGYSEALKILKEIRPEVVFTKGGYVSVPPALAAHALHIKVVTHESDMTPGLANKIIGMVADKICVTFPETLEMISKKKGVFTGTPIRDELLTGNGEKAAEMLSFEDKTKPTLLVTGGSLGAQSINNRILRTIGEITKTFNIIHLTGKGKATNDEDLLNKYKSSYRQFEFASDEMKDFLDLADVIVTRSGSNAIHEFAFLAKPMLLIPLPKSQSRGDQILNADSFVKREIAVSIDDDTATDDEFLNTLNSLYENRASFIEKMKNSGIFNPNEAIAKIIEGA